MLASEISQAACEASRLPEEIRGDWRMVRGDGFTYCVPADWQAVGPRAERWRSATVDVSWNDPTGFERPLAPVNPVRGQTGAPFGSRASTIEVDGRLVRLEITDGAQATSWMAAASWLEPALRFYATARTATASDEVIAVVRSVRFSR